MMTEDLHCYGCGGAHQGRWVVVVSLGGRWQSAPVCNACFVDPSHRKATIDGHFFPAEVARQAVAAAGSSNLGMGGQGLR